MDERGLDLVERVRALEILLMETNKRLDERFRAQEQARDLALSGQKYINEKANEFRGALEDQATQVELTMLPRREYVSQHEALTRELDVLRDRLVREAQGYANEFAEIRRDLILSPQQRHVQEEQRKTTRLSGWIAAAGVLAVVVSGAMYLIVFILSGK